MKNNTRNYRLAASAQFLRILTAALFGIALGTGGCDSGGDGSPAGPGGPGDTADPGDSADPGGNLEPEGFEVAQSALSRDLDPAATPAQLNELVGGNTAFALDLYTWLRTAEPEDNLFYSPHSISVALAMTQAGAQGQTADEMAAALHFTLPGDTLHQAMNKLALSLAEREKVEVPEGKPFALRVVNALWGLDNYPYGEAFLDTLAVNYGAGMFLVDFLSAAEEARQTINAWVAKATNNLIPELIPDGAITSDTRLVITNAIYFFAGWNTPFSKELTADAPFTALSGEEQTVKMMTLNGDLNYGEHLGAQIIELPYVGEEVSMVVVLPEAGQFSAFEDSLDAATIDALVGSLQGGSGTLRMPKLELKAQFSLKKALSDLGMPSAFISGAADFSEITTAEQVYIHDVLHEGVVKIDEEGTEAAAATAVIIGVESAPSLAFNMTLDRPYIFFIRDRVTGAILFVGRVVHFGA